MKKLSIFMLLCVSFQGFSQTLRSLNDKADFYKTEESFGKFASRIRVLADDITKDEVGYSLSLSLIAFKDSTEWQSDEMYKKSTFLRNTQLNATDYSKLRKAGLKMTFKPVNKRDETLYYLKQPSAYGDLNLINMKVIRAYKEDLKKKGMSETEASSITQTAFLQLTSDSDFNTLDSNLKKRLYHEKYEVSGGRKITFIEMWEFVKGNYDRFAKAVQRRPLFTVSPEAVYNYGDNRFSKVALNSTYLVSLTKNVDKKPWEFIVDGSAAFENDTTTLTTDLDKRLASLSIGINKVLFEKDGQSAAEFKFSGKYSHNLRNGAKQNDPELFATCKIKITKNIWIPLTVSYMPGKGNLTGFLNLSINTLK